MVYIILQNLAVHSLVFYIFIYYLLPWLSHLWNLILPFELHKANLTLHLHKNGEAAVIHLPSKPGLNISLVLSLPFKRLFKEQM